MSIGNEIAYRRSRRGKDATGSLVFDAERRQAQGASPDDDQRSEQTATKKQIIEQFPG